MGARPEAQYGVDASLEFQSTRPHGGATKEKFQGLIDLKFQSTRPHGGATYKQDPNKDTQTISIHAPAWGRDRAGDGRPYCFNDFNPRARMGARLRATSTLISISSFQSTRPHGGATG